MQNFTGSCIFPKIFYSKNYINLLIFMNFKEYSLLISTHEIVGDRGSLWVMVSYNSEHTMPFGRTDIEFYPTDCGINCYWRYKDRLSLSMSIDYLLLS